MKVSWPTMSADDAAEIIQHNDMVAFSGFTPAGSPKALPAAIARRANVLHQMRQPFQIRLLTGASISAAADDALSDADAVSWRAPYQTSTGLRQKINQGQVKFVDLHLSEVAQMVNYGFFGDIDVAVIEATAITSDGRVWLSSGIGNAPTWLLRAKKVIIELNHYHNPRVAELADIVIPGAPPRRNSVAIFHALDRVGNQYVQINPRKIIAVVETNLPDAGNVLDNANPISQQIADNVVTFLLDEMAQGRIPAEFFTAAKRRGKHQQCGDGAAWRKPGYSVLYDVFRSVAGVCSSSAGDRQNHRRQRLQPDAFRRLAAKDLRQYGFLRQSYRTAPAGDLQ
ncbi:propionyl-CoA:succinate CoA transferase [Salmonella enterica subsp. arizonae]|nr:propionyl-CoA:succinate CoA transferase [Salmonella enterica subsp. arizonae]